MLEGLPPHRPSHVLRLLTDERSARAMTDLLGEMFDPMETAVAAFEDADGRTGGSRPISPTRPTRTTSAR